MKKIMFFVSIMLFAAIGVALPAEASIVSSYTKVQSFSYDPTGTEISHLLLCNTGDEVSGGGFRLTSNNPLVKLMSSQPNGSGTGWEVSAINNDGAETDIHVYAVCLA